MDRKKFYDTIRPHMNLTTQNVLGTEKHLDYLLHNSMPINRASYALATSWWETGQTMHPVREAFYISKDFAKAEAWRKKHLRYYPWYGRGLIQTTWEENYRKIAVAIGLPEDAFIKNPNLLLEWKYALPALFVGMERGIYTGKDLEDYIDLLDEPDSEDLREYVNARRIVNGTNKAQTIGNLALAFERGLKAAGYTGMPVPSPRPGPTPTPSPPHTPTPAPYKAEPSHWVALVIGVMVIAAVVAFIILS